MAEIPAPEGQINGGGTLPQNPNNNPNPSEPIVASKRQRRPSVRLGDIGDQSYDSHPRRSTATTTTTKQWRLAFDHHRKDPSASTSGKPSKTRPLTNLTEFGEALDGDNEREGNLDSVVIGSWKVKESKKRGSSATKRVRSNWVSRIDESGGGGVEGDDNNKYSGDGDGGGGGGGDDDVDDGYRDFDMENSDSALKEQSPMNSTENLGGDDGNERDLQVQNFHGSRRLSIRARVSEGRDNLDGGVELSGPSDNGVRDIRNRSDERGRCGEDGVRIWLNGLGLGRYAPVFEIHEVDDEVLPLLTLEDLKDMGISAVGSRRKMYCAIQKLGKGFS